MFRCTGTVLWFSSLCVLVGEPLIGFVGYFLHAQGDSRQPCTMLWSDGMSAVQARKALFGGAAASGGSDTLGKPLPLMLLMTLWES